MAGEVNGSDVFIAVETAPASTIFTQIGGLISNSTTFNNGAIDITSKDLAWRKIMAAEGLQSMDISAEVLFSTDALFQVLKASYLAKTILSYKIARGALVLAFDAYVTSWAESSPDNDKVTVSVSLQSSGAITDA